MFIIFTFVFDTRYHEMVTFHFQILLFGFAYIFNV